MRDQGAEADLKILLNMDENKNDGNLLFLMGRCCEDGKNDVDAVKWYRKAIEHECASSESKPTSGSRPCSAASSTEEQRCRSSHRGNGQVRP